MLQIKNQKIATLENHIHILNIANDNLIFDIEFIRDKAICDNKDNQPYCDGVKDTVEKIINLINKK